MSDVAQKVWGFCHTRRHDDVDYYDYIEQLSYLLFFKMINTPGTLYTDLRSGRWRSLAFDGPLVTAPS
jgi:hypothetical protein